MVIIVKEGMHCVIRQIFVIFAMGLLPAATCLPGIAGIAHVGSNLLCSDCHTMHYSMEHGYEGETADLDPNSYSTRLLKASPNDLCLGCHDGNAFAPDVLGTAATGYPRQAGALNRESQQIAGYQQWTGHTLDSRDVAPGGTWSNIEHGLQCIDCHAAHGIATQYRNLRTTDTLGDPFANKSVTFSTGSGDMSKDVQILSYDFASRYGVDGVRFNEPDPTKSSYANWCAGCHGDYHGAGGTVNMGGASGGDTGNTGWKRHPVADVNIGANSGERSSLQQYQSHTNKVKVMSSSGNWDTGTDVTPSCFTCHKAHGNKNPFGLIYMSGNGVISEEGDSGGSGVRELCRQCHTQ